MRKAKARLQRHVGRTLLLLAAHILVLLTVLLCPRKLPAEASSPPSLPVLRTARQVHELTTEQSRQRYPVLLRVALVYYDSYIDQRYTAIFVHDASGSVFVSAPSTRNKNILPGTIVEIRGFSGPGDFAPIVEDALVTVVGPGPLPADARDVDLASLLSGQYDGQWVKVKGVIQAVSLVGQHATMQLKMAEGIISVTMLVESGVDYASLVDARVEMLASEAPLFNSNMQMIGARLLCPSRAAIVVKDPAPSDTFASPARTVQYLSQFHPGEILEHRVHLHGTATFDWPGSLLCLELSGGALCARTSQLDVVQPGTQVDVAGFVTNGGSAPMLTDAVFRSSPVHLEVKSGLISVEQALSGTNDARLVQMEGVLIGRDLAAAEPTLMLASGKYIFPVLLPKGVSEATLAQWKNGSRLRVTGVCLVLLDFEKSTQGAGAAVAQSFRILLQSPEDVLVVERASWWTPQRALILVSLVLAVVLLASGWIALLTRQVEQQTRLVRESEERYRHIAQHDVLTGLPSRLLLHERLELAIRRAGQRGSGLAVLMLDLDGFKKINDSLGHQAGDDTLLEAARRIITAIRKEDMAARTGGDEFVVVLEGIEQQQDAERAAAEIVQVLSTPLSLGGLSVPLSSSVGVYVAFGKDLRASDLLKKADIALYRAKAGGRNRYEVYIGEPERGAPLWSSAPCDPPAANDRHRETSLTSQS